MKLKLSSGTSFVTALTRSDMQPAGRHHIQSAVVEGKELASEERVGAALPLPTVCARRLARAASY